MSIYNVFISYNMSVQETPIIWQIQLMATHYDMGVFVPFPEDRRPKLLKKVKTLIDKSNCLIGFFTKNIARNSLAEINYALQKGKKIIAVVSNGTNKQELENLGIKVFPYDIDNYKAGELEQKIFTYLLEQQQLKEEQANAVATIIGFAGGLLLLYLLSKEK